MNSRKNKKIFIKSKQQILKEQILKEQKIDELKKGSNEFNNNWRQIKALHKSLKIKDKEVKLKELWKKRSGWAFSIELKRLRKLEEEKILVKKKKKRVPKEIKPKVKTYSPPDERYRLYKQYERIMKKNNKKIKPFFSKGLTEKYLIKQIKKYDRPKTKEGLKIVENKKVQSIGIWDFEKYDFSFFQKDILLFV